MTPNNIQIWYNSYIQRTWRSNNSEEELSLLIDFAKDHNLYDEEAEARNEMNVTRPILRQVPEDKDWQWDTRMYRSWTWEPLSEYDIRDLKDFDRVYYWYESWSYEWSWYMIGIKNGKWYWKDMWHCSCYGPTEGIENATPYNSFEECLANATFTHVQKEYIKKDYL